MPAPMFEPPYVAVIFCSSRRDGDDGYAAMADRMVALSQESDGFLGIEHARDPDGDGLTVCYWQDEAAVAAWKANSEHALAQKLGKTRWYEAFSLRIATVTRNYDFNA